jgi:rare lipoprotein A
MRHLLPLAATAAALTTGVAPATARQPHHHHQPQRVKAHVSLHLSRHTALGGSRIAVSGKVRPGGRHRVKVVLRGPDAGVRGLTTRPDGTFSLRWAPRRVGNYAVRAFGVHDAGTRGSASRARHLTSYRPAAASYYGPGLYGNGVACGGTLMPATLGVANKTLPCGTKVKLRYRGRSVTVPVIDRGPYVAGRDYDLTEATRRKLGFPGVGTVLANR